MCGEVVILRSFIVFLFLLLCPAISHANGWWPYPQPEYFDYSDAPGYGDAWHQTDQWQKLGDANVSKGYYLLDDAAAWDKEGQPKDVDTSDDGVWWRTDESEDWGHEAVDAGDTILIRILAWSAGAGNHPFDRVNAWVDLDQDKIFNNDGLISENNGELLVTKDINKYPAGTDPSALEDGDETYQIGTLENDPWQGNKYDQNYFYDDFVTEIIVELTIPEYVKEDLWLRARIACSESVQNNGGGTLSPY